MNILKQLDLDISPFLARPPALKGWYVMGKRVLSLTDQNVGLAPKHFKKLCFNIFIVAVQVWSCRSNHKHDSAKCHGGSTVDGKCPKPWNSPGQRI